MGEEFTDVKIKDVKAYIQNGRAMDVDGAKFGIMNRVYLNVDIDRDGCLLVETGEGTRRVMAGDVSIRPVDAPIPERRENING